MASPFVKIATLGSFALLLGTFVAYRSGVFSQVSLSDMSSSSIYGTRSMTEETAEGDTLPPGADTFKIDNSFIYSSKSGAIIDPSAFDNKEKGKKKQKKPKKQEINNIIIPSSKSGAIFLPESRDNRVK